MGTPIYFPDKNILSKTFSKLLKLAVIFGDSFLQTHNFIIILL